MISTADYQELHRQPAITLAQCCTRDYAVASKSVRAVTALWQRTGTGFENTMSRAAVEDGANKASDHTWADQEWPTSTDPVVVHRPSRVTVPLVLSSPHSGRHYPVSFLEASRLDLARLRRSEDCFVEELFADAVSLGAPLLAARFPRAYIDVNREPFELDPELFSDALPDYANTRSLRVAGGLGTIARVVADGEEIYRAPMRTVDALQRIARLYRPYHQMLATLLEQATRRFGAAVLIDCHSMPSNGCGATNRPDFVLGDRFGTSCDPALTRHVSEVLKEMGYDVALNRPYAGGYITEHYGRPSLGAHALQLEVNRALYMDEQTLRPTRGFDQLRIDMLALCDAVIVWLQSMVIRHAAAE
jgi:N-formylglutamate amidohydrolase